METGKWISVEVPAEVKNLKLSSVAGGAYGDKVYFFGGVTSSSAYTNKVMMYDTATNLWSAKSPALVSRCCITTIQYKDAFYLFGGHGGDKKAVEKYSIATDSWTKLSNFPVVRSYCAYAAVGDTAYLAGGFSSTASNELYSYNFVSGATNKLANMQIPIYYENEMPYYNNALYVFGGVMQGEIIDRTIQRYDIETDAWSIVGTLPSDCGISTVQVGNQVFLLGGTTSRSYIYDLDLGSLTPMADMNYVTQHAKMLIGNKIYSFDNYNSIEYYELPQDPDPTSPKSCFEVEMKIKACSSNALFQQLCTMIGESGCECNCDCTCGPKPTNP